jgi:predicted double-glycine peptidase
VIDLPIGRQTFDFDCGAKALQLVMAYYGIDIREDELIKKLKTDKYGTSVKNMISVAKQEGFQVLAKSRVALGTLKKYIDENHPVIVLVQAWAERYMTIEDWKEDISDGHYVIIIGYSGNIIVFEDPASFRRTWMTEEEFIVRWHDVSPRTKERYDHFTMILLGKQPARKKLEHMD